MKYSNIHCGTFISRPNRFIAHVLIDGKDEICHVKNTGRCKELLTENAQVYLVHSDNPNRKTKYDLVCVNKCKGGKLINFDSQAPNAVVHEWLKSNPFGNDFEIFPESTYGNSRLDFCLKSKTSDKKIYIEVKGATLEENGCVMFPDAPTERGIKHLHELCRCVNDGFEAYILFLVQMSNVKYFTPNYKTHAAFGEALKNASASGVKILCFDCLVTPDSITLNKPVKVKL